MLVDQTQSNNVWLPKHVNVVLSGQTVLNICGHRPNKQNVLHFDIKLFVGLQDLLSMIEQGT